MAPPSSRPGALAGFSKAATMACWVAVGLVSLWIRMAFPVMAIGPASHDDMLYVRYAADIGAGHWLGSYSHLTHAKGVAYSLFLALNHLAGLPLKFTEHLVYLAASAFFAATLRQLCRSRWSAFAVWVLLAFVPTAWIDGVGGRVVREGLYVSLSLLLLAFGMRCWVLPLGPDGVDTGAGGRLRRRWLSFVFLGVVAGLFWLTREEGVWLVPAMLVLLGYWLWRERSHWRHWRPLLGCIALPVSACALVVGAVNAANLAAYGVFLNNELRSSAFQEGYGALLRIRHAQWQRYVLFPRDARQLAYEMSSAARELQPFFEGEGGETWRRIGCEQTATSPCGEILSGWFVWALREAVAKAGHYRDARAAQAFYSRLAHEIDQGCLQRPADCLPKHASLAPPWRAGYALDTAKAAASVFRTLSTLGDPRPNIGNSWGAAEQLALFSTVTHSRLAPPADAQAGGSAAPSQGLRHALAARLGSVESALSTVGLPAACLGWLLWMVVAAARRTIDPALVVATALAAAVAGRVGLLAFLEATTMPGNNMLYLLPVVPMSLAMIPLVASGIAAPLRDLRLLRAQGS